MAHVSAISPRNIVPAIRPAAPKASLWILSSWRDLILYVGTPLLLVPMFALAQARWRAQDIYVFVAAFGATGHHLPGMIRAYGDRALFERFRWRFIFAPLFLLGVCLAFTWWDLKGLVLVVFFWGVWHGMMQTYGFCRIYDAKAGSFAGVTRRIDFATCAIWFASAVLISRQRMADTLDTYYASGGPFVPPAFLHHVQQIALGAALAVTIVFLGNFIWMCIAGKRPNPVKVALLLTSISFWWYCNNGVSNILAGIALFEVFHDVQYLSLVWIYNRNRVEKDKSIGGFMRFVFRRSGSLVGLYVGLVFAYGSLAYFKETDIDVIKRFLTGVVAASGLLHFYYDGFIWKVREKTTRQHLGLAGGTATVQTNQFLPSWASHGLKWVAVFIVPLCALCWGQIWRAPSSIVNASSVVADIPENDRARVRYGLALLEEQRFDEAGEEFRAALQINPAVEKAHYGLARVHLAQNKSSQAAAELEQAMREDPHNGEIHTDYGFVLDRLGRNDQANAEYEKAVRMSPKSAKAHYNYAMFLFGHGSTDKAIGEFEAAARWKSNQPEVYYYLGRAYFLKNDLLNAQANYEEAARLDPNAPVHNSLGVVYMKLGERIKAIAQFKEALRLQPSDSTAAENLRFAETGERPPGAARSPQ